MSCKVLPWCLVGVLLLTPLNKKIPTGKSVRHFREKGCPTASPKGDHAPMTFTPAPVRMTGWGIHQIKGGG